MTWVAVKGGSRYRVALTWRDGQEGLASLVPATGELGRSFCRKEVVRRCYMTGGGRRPDGSTGPSGPTANNSKPVLATASAGFLFGRGSGRGGATAAIRVRILWPGLCADALPPSKAIDKALDPRHTALDHKGCLLWMQIRRRLAARPMSMRIPHIIEHLLEGLGFPCIDEAAMLLAS